MSAWLGFAACSLVIVYAGWRLSKYGYVIADRIGLERSWIGVILLASVTSLPELVTGISSVTYARAPDIAVGDVLGSCAFNLVILAILDAMHPRHPVLSHARRGNAMTAAFGVVMIGAASLSIVVGGAAPRVGWIGVNSVLFLALYLVAMRAIFRSEHHPDARSAARDGPPPGTDLSLRSALVGYVVNAAAVVAAAIFLPGFAQELAERTGLGGTFVGTAFVALTTSLPEVVVCVAAVRLGSIDMAVGNVLGSNLFDIGILAVDDIFYTGGMLVADVKPTHAVTGMCATVMTGFVILGLTAVRREKCGPLSWESVAIVATYGANLALLYELR